MRLKSENASASKVGGEKTFLSKLLGEKDLALEEMRGKLSQLSIEVANLESELDQERSKPASFLNEECKKCPFKDQQLDQLTY